MAKQKSEKYKTRIVEKHLNDGVPITELMKEAGVTRNTIVSWIRKYQERLGIVVKRRPAFQRVVHDDDVREVVRMMNSGDYTLQMIGDRHGVSRERIRQILVRETGSGGGKKQIKDRKLAKMNREVYLSSFAYNCVACGKAVTNREAKTGDKYCKKCRQMTYDGLDPCTTLTCLWCGADYHPRRAYKHLPYDPKTCSISCGIKYRKRNKRMGAYDRNRKKD